MLPNCCKVWGGYLDILEPAEKASEWHKTALLEKLLKFQAIAPGRREKLPGKKDRTDWDTGKHPHSGFNLFFRITRQILLNPVAQNREDLQNSEDIQNEDTNIQRIDKNTRIYKNTGDLQKYKGSAADV